MGHSAHLAKQLACIITPQHAGLIRSFLVSSLIFSQQTGQVSVFAGGTMEDSDAPARQAAVDRGNTIVILNEEETAQWVEASKPIYDEWVAEMNAKGIDGQALINEARSLIDTYTE